MSDKEMELLEGACLTLEQLCAAGAIERAWLVARVDAGLIPASGGRFAAAALVADLLEEMDALRARLARGR